MKKRESAIARVGLVTVYGKQAEIINWIVAVGLVCIFIAYVYKTLK